MKKFDILEKCFCVTNERPLFMVLDFKKVCSKKSINSYHTLPFIIELNTIQKIFISFLDKDYGTMKGKYKIIYIN